MAQVVIGADLGGTNLRCALVDAERNVLHRHEEPTRAEEGPDAVTERIAGGVKRVVAESGVAAEDVLGIGVGCPGPLDGRRGIVLKAPNMPGWEHYPIATRLRERTGFAVVLENDANAAGWGEFWAGAGRGCRSMILMTLGTGVGGAIILNGEILHGPDWTAGEIGHAVIVDGGRPCGCGWRGCLEAYASATATVARFRESVEMGWESALAKRPVEEITCRAIFEAAAAGDDLARHTVAETGRYLGIMAANMANLLNPERCVFSGGMVRSGDLLLDPIRAVVWKHAFGAPAARMEILPATLGDDAGLIGAAGCALVASGISA